MLSHPFSRQAANFVLSWIDAAGASATRGRRILLVFGISFAPTALLVVAALLLAVRRLSGALTTPLGLAAAAICSAVVIALLAAPRRLRAVFADYDLELPGPVLLASAVEPLVQIAATFVLAFALSLPAASTPSKLMLALPALGLVGRTLWERFRPVPNELRAWTPPMPTRPSSNVSLTMTRSTEADGTDVCRGSARAEFAVGQRTAAIHLAFCPPFATTPRIEAVAADAGDVTVKVGQALPYAARLDVKRSQPAAATHDVVVAFTALSPT